ncbi:hypothetical protein EBH_0033290 [Eimeria brunetti]|uniref:Uncharacterized protein n=1 Tax=Eimeria brunetti TaxID=51314 RepID=U6LJ57_9EIME|nr:hypothetical protein EBH_0033290 [Eimeria brunetti]
MLRYRRARQFPSSTESPPSLRYPIDRSTKDYDEPSPRPIAKLEYTQFDQRMQSERKRDTPVEILEVLQTHRAAFADSLPTGLTPKRAHDHRILLAPGTLPTKSTIYRMTPDQLFYHKQEIAKLLANGWIGPAYSPICAPTIMVDKRDDGSGERKMRMVVNYQELNALTIAPNFPLPPIQMILEMLGGAQYFCTLDLEAGFHQIRMAQEYRWKTAFRSVMGPFEYKVMPFGLNGAPATFQANINAYLQPLLGPGVIAYLDDVLIYSPDLPSHCTLLRHVLGIFFQYQFYPKFSKCKLTRRELTYLGYNVSADGIKPAKDKIGAIQVWPEVLMNETQVRQFLGAVNYCRMFMGPGYAEVARPLVDLTRKDVHFQWTDPHTQAVRKLKQRLIDYTTLQVPETSQPFALYTDASGYAIGAVLEQAGKPIEFHNQATNSAQQKYSIYDQDLLALITALGKWSHLVRAAKVTTYTNHQALTHLQQLKASRPLRGRIANPETAPPAAEPQATTGPPNLLDWVAGYSNCSAFRDPYHFAVQQAGEAIQWSHVSLDFITDLPLTTCGHDSILVLVDSLSKMAHFDPAKKSFSAAGTVELLADRLICYYGFPEALISDRDPRFRSDLWCQLRTRFNIKRAMSSFYHPQTDAQTERVNRTLEQMLRTYIQADEREWESLLPAWELA